MSAECSPRWTAYVVSLVTSALLVLGCSSDPPAELVVRPVKTMLITPAGDVRSRTFPGTVGVARQVELAFRVPGLLESFPVKEGQSVTKGTLVAQLRQNEFDARVKTLQGDLDRVRASLQALRAGERPEEIRRREAELRAAEARLVNARADFERNSQLVTRRVVPRDTFEQSKTDYRVAQEAVTSARMLLDQATSGRQEDIEAMEANARTLEGRLIEAEVQRDDATLLAPYDGVIAQRFVDQGQTIAAGDRVVRFQDLEEIDILVDVPETVMAADIRRAEIEQMTAGLSSATGVGFPVRIREIAKVADPVTQTFQVRFAMESPTDLTVLPGMTATVTLVYRPAAVHGNRPMVPIEAIVGQESGESVAWVLDQDGTVAPRSVKVGTARGGQLEVVDGLDVGDRVVIAGARFLRAGMKVRDLGDALGARRL